LAFFAPLRETAFVRSFFLAPRRQARKDDDCPARESENADAIDPVSSRRYGEIVSYRPKPVPFSRPAKRTDRRKASIAADDYSAPCPHYPRCVGCPFINLPYPEQLNRKRQIVTQAFAAYPALSEVAVADVLPAPRRLGYRARVKLVVRKTKGEMAVGLYVPGSHHVIDISSCPVHAKPINDVIRYLKQKCRDLDIPPYDERDDSGQLRYLDFRQSFFRRELVVTLVTRHAAFPQGGALARSLMRRFGFIVGVVQNTNEAKGNVIWGEKFRTLGGRDTLLERIGSFQLGFPAGVFSQANPFTARQLYEWVAKSARLTGKETALDLYCGVGPISLFLATSARQVWGIDDDALSIATAKQNARRNGISNCRFVEGDVAMQATEIKSDLKHIDLVVLNPPRKGVQPAAMEAVLALNSHQIIYVSCDPTSLGRDVNRLVEDGFQLRAVQPFDMFPQTEEVETVAVLEKIELRT
jgi:23S rRNA (uracil-5-)-methyltransferase RumA